MDEDLWIISQWVFIGLLLWIAYVIYKYSKKEIIIDTEYKKDGYSFSIKTTHYRYFHISRKRRNIYQTIISGNKVLPNLFLDSHHKDKFLYASEYATYDQSQRVGLEGDFDNFFQLYVPKGLENDALVLLSPDVMLIIRDKLRKTDVLIEYKNIVLLSNDKIEVEELLKGINSLLDKIARAYKYINYDEQVHFSNVLIKRNATDEAVKISSRLVSAKTLAYWFILFLPGILYTIYIIIAPLEKIQIGGFIIGLFVSLGFGALTMLVLLAVDKYNNHRRT